MGKIPQMQIVVMRMKTVLNGPGLAGAKATQNTCSGIAGLHAKGASALQKVQKKSINKYHTTVTF